MSVLELPPTQPHRPDQNTSSSSFDAGTLFELYRITTTVRSVTAVQHHKQLPEMICKDSLQVRLAVMVGLLGTKSTSYETILTAQIPSIPLSYRHEIVIVDRTGHCSHGRKGASRSNPVPLYQPAGQRLVSSKEQERRR